MDSRREKGDGSTAEMKTVEINTVPQERSAKLSASGTAEPKLNTEDLMETLHAEIRSLDLVHVNWCAKY